MNVVFRTPQLAGLMAALATMLASAVPARAQDGLIVNGRWVSAVRQFGADLGPAPDGWLAPSAGGGRYAVNGHTVTDRRTGSRTQIPYEYDVLLPDPVRPRVFVRVAGPTTTTIAEYSLATGTMRPLTPIPFDAVQNTWNVQYAHAADQLFIDIASYSAPEDDPHDFRVVDATTGAEITRFQVTRRSYWPWVVTPDGATMYLLSARRLEGWTTFISTVSAIDVRSGARAARTMGYVGGLQWDELNERLFVDASNAIHVLDARLAPLVSAPVPQDHPIVISPHTGRLYLAAGQFHGILGGGLGLTVVDSATYAPLGYVSSYARGAWLTLLSAPGAPRALAATTAPGVVSLTWTNIGAASHFVLDVGAAPGRTDLSIHLGPEPRASFTGVPPGAYFLRMRGGNEFGGGRSSNEITVVVP